MSILAKSGDNEGKDKNCCSSSSSGDERLHLFLMKIQIIIPQFPEMKGSIFYDKKQSVEFFYFFRR